MSNCCARTSFDKKLYIFIFYTKKIRYLRVDWCILILSFFHESAALFIFFEPFARFARLIKEPQSVSRRFQMRYKKVILMSVLALSFSAGAYARNGKAGKGANPGEGRFMQELNLTAEQKTKIASLRSAKKEKLTALREKQKNAKEALEKAMEASASDADLKKAHQELQAVKRELADERFDSLLSIRSVLTPEQRAKMKELRGERGSRLNKFKSRRAKGGGGRGQMNFGDEDEQD